MKVIKHNGGYLLDPRLMGRIELLVELLKQNKMDAVSEFILEKVTDGFKEWPPTVVHVAESLELKNDPA